MNVGEHVLQPGLQGLPGAELRPVPGELSGPAPPHRPLPGITFKKKSKDCLVYISSKLYNYL